MIRRNEIKRGIYGLTSRASNAELLLAKSIQSDVLLQLIQAIEKQTGLRLPPPEGILSSISFHIQHVQEISYILCPVPWASIGDMREAGFALNVDDKELLVYAYLHDNTLNETLVLLKWPISFVDSIFAKLDIFSGLRKRFPGPVERVVVSFIAALAVDIASMQIDPVMVFPDPLYQQLLTRLQHAWIPFVAEQKWRDQRLAQRRLEHIVSQFSKLDAHPLSQASRFKSIVHSLENFLFGVADLLGDLGVRNNVDLSPILPYLAQIYGVFIEEHRIAHANFLKEWTGVAPVLALERVEEMSEQFFEALDIINASSLQSLTGIAPREDIVRRACTRLIVSGDFATVSNYQMFHGMESSVDEKEIQAGYKDMVARGEIHKAKMVEKITGIKPSIEPSAIEAALQSLILDNRNRIAEELKEWFNIGKKLNNVDTHARYHDLLMAGSIGEACSLQRMTGVAPKAHVIKLAFHKLINLGMLVEAMDLAAWSGIDPILDREEIQEGYQSWLRACWNLPWGHAVIRLFHLLLPRIVHWAGASPDETTLTNTVNFWILNAKYGDMKRIIAFVNKFLNGKLKIGAEAADSVIQRGYEHFISENLVWDVISLYRLSHIRPRLSNAKFEDIVKKILSGGAINLAEKWVRMMERPMPAIEYSIIKPAFLKLAERRNIKDIEKIITLTGHKPAFDEKVIQDTYKNILQYDRTMEDFFRWKRITGARAVFNAETVQGVYETCILFGNIEKALVVKKISKILPEINGNVRKKTGASLFARADERGLKKLKEFLGQ